MFSEFSPCSLNLVFFFFVLRVLKQKIKRTKRDLCVFVVFLEQKIVFENCNQIGSNNLHLQLLDFKALYCFDRSNEDVQH